MLITSYVEYKTVAVYLSKSIEYLLESYLRNDTEILPAINRNHSQNGKYYMAFMLALEVKFIQEPEFLNLTPCS